MSLPQSAHQVHHTKSPIDSRSSVSPTAAAAAVDSTTIERSSGMKTTRMSSINAGSSTLLLKSDQLNNSTQSLNQNQSQNQIEADSTGIKQDPATGLTRRPSVTARPGDIFYKVKDVTDAATTDTLDHENSTHHDNEETEAVASTATPPVNQSYTISVNNDNSLTTQVTEKTFGSFAQRKTTTWNVKRHQTTSLGINAPQQEPPKVVPTKEDIQVEEVSNVQTEAPLFNRELLSIR